MADSSQSKQSGDNVHQLLSGVRRRIRWLVLLEGLALAFICMVLLFWISLAMDYLPVKFGFEELPKTVRTIILALSGIAVFTIFYKVVLKRIFVSLENRSMALLVEKKHPQFGESLITTVEFDSNPDSEIDQPTLLQISRDKANRLAGDIDAKTLLNDNHVRRYFYGALIGLASVLIFAISSPAAMGTAISRLYFLDQQQWERESLLEWVALKAEYESPVAGIPEFDQPIQLVPATDNSPSTYRIAKGTTLKLTVKARSDQPLATGLESDTPVEAKKLPRSCKLQFQSADGDYGSQTLNRVGGERGGWQLYRLQGSPLTTMTSDLDFSIFGGDYRIGPHRIAVVDEPVVTSTELDCSFPVYMKDENSLRGSDRTLKWVGKTELPYGTRINIRSVCNKPLKKVYVVDQSADKESDADEEQAIPLATVNDTGFEFPIDQLFEPVTLQFYLVDTDGIVSPSPHTVSVSPIADQPPTVDATLAGIGSAITPNAVLPVDGMVEDDYDIDQAWLEIETPVTDTLMTDVEVKRGGTINTKYDFQEMAMAEKGFVLPTSGGEITLVLKATDKFDLGAGPNVGIGDQYTLSIVSPAALLQILEQLEVGQRKRLELIFNEVSDIREYLIRTRKRDQNSTVDLQPGESANNLPGDSNDDPQATEKAKQQRNELRQLFAQRAILQADKSAKEIIGVAESFDDIRLQLINNRVDSEDRKIRLEKKIVLPLRNIPEGVLNELRAVVVELENELSFSMTAAKEETAAKLSESAIRLTDETLIQIDEVLSILVKYETQNELLDIVRRMIKEQEQLLDETKKLRQREAFDDLFD